MVSSCCEVKEGLLALHPSNVARVGENFRIVQGRELGASNYHGWNCEIVMRYEVRGRLIVDARGVKRVERVQERYTPGHRPLSKLSVHDALRDMPRSQVRPVTNTISKTTSVLLFFINYSFYLRLGTKLS